MKLGKIYIGTSGWSYAGWNGTFYPEKIKPKDVLPFYADQFNSVELNNSFYQIPKTNNVKIWHDVTPKDFIFSCKANRYITHMKKLQDVEETVQRMLGSFEQFEEKLGPILFQFPPYWPLDLSTLNNFIEELPKTHRYTFEFRHKSWFCNQLYDLLNHHQMALCFYNFRTYQSPEVVTSSFIYQRMHGPTLEPYQGSYGDDRLKKYAEKIMDWQQEGKNIYCYFDNDEKGYAPHDALSLKKIIHPAIKD